MSTPQLYRVTVLDPLRGRRRVRRRLTFAVLATSRDGAVDVLRKERPLAFVYGPDVSSELLGACIVPIL